MTSESSGNALIYVLIAIILLGALTFAISRSSDSNPQGEISEAAAKAAATSILAYEAQAKSAVNQMIMNGTKVDEINFDFPSAATFNSGDTTKKLFHPDGGGLQYKALPSTADNKTNTSPPSGFYIGKYNNYSWTTSGAQDVIFSAYNLKQEVCIELNRKLTASVTIPSVTVDSTRMLTVPSQYYGGSPANSNFTPTKCPACEGKPSFCISNTSPGGYSFYSILVAR